MKFQIGLVVNKFKIIIAYSICLLLGHDVRAGINNWPVVGNLIHVLSRSTLTAPIVSFIGRHKVATTLAIGSTILGTILWKNKTANRYLQDAKTKIGKLASQWKFSLPTRAPCCPIKDNQAPHNHQSKQIESSKKAEEVKKYTLHDLREAIETGDVELLNNCVAGGVAIDGVLSELTSFFDDYDFNVANFLVVIDCLKKHQFDINQLADGKNPLLHVVLNKLIALNGWQKDKKKNLVSALEGLIERGSDVNGKNKDGLSPLEFCIKQHAPQSEIICLLIKKGAKVQDPAVLDEQLGIAISSRNINYLDALFTAGARLTCIGEQDEPRIHEIDWLCVGEDTIKTVKWLLDHGVAIDERNKKGNTLLQEVLSQRVKRLGMEPNSIIAGLDILVPALIARGANINVQDSQGNTLLHGAVCQRNEKGVKYLLDLGASGNIKNNANVSPLDILLNSSCMVPYMYVDRDIINMIQMFNKAGVKCTSGLAKNGYMLKALAQAISRCDLECVRLLLDVGVKVKSVRDPDNTWFNNEKLQPALHLIDYNNYSNDDVLGMVRYLMEHDVSIDQRDKKGHTLLFKVIKEISSCAKAEKATQVKNRLIHLARELNKLGADIVHGPDMEGQSCLHYFIERHCTRDQIKLLIELGARVGSVDDGGNTPLMSACKNPRAEALIGFMEGCHGSCPEIIPYLVNQPNKEFEFPIHCILQQPHGTCWFAELLSLSKENINAIGRKRYTPLHYAAANPAANKELIDYLTQAGAKLDAETVDNETALDLAAHNENWEVVERLLTLKSSLARHVCNDGWTPLFAAVKNGRLDICQMMVERGASVNQVWHSDKGDKFLEDMTTNVHIKELILLCDTRCAKRIAF